MCRKNQLIAWAAIAFGMGLLIGARLGVGFVTNCFSFTVIIIGCTWFRKK